MTIYTVRDSTDLIAAFFPDPIIQPGDIIELEDGIYTGDFRSKIAGTFENPCIIRPRNAGKVTLDGSLWISGNCTDWYDFDFTDSRTDRYVYTQAIYTARQDIGIYGFLVRDLHNSGITMYGPGIGEISECVIYNNGGRDPDASGHGHAIYTHNNNNGSVIIARNIFGNQFGDYALHIYSGGDNLLNDYNVYDNVTCGDPTHTGGGLGLVNFLYQRNIQYGNYIQHGRYTIKESEGWHNIHGQILDNEMLGLYSYTVNQENTLDWEDLTESGNIFYGDAYPSTYMPINPLGYSLVSEPSTKIWIMPFTKSARWLGMVTIYNRDSANTVGVDLSSLLPNGHYRLRNGQNMVETWEFNQIGGTVYVPMNIWSVSDVIGEGKGESHLPIFGSFVIESSPVIPTYLPIVSGKPNYVHPIANSLLNGTLATDLIDMSFDGKHIDPYKKKH